MKASKVLKYASGYTAIRNIFFVSFGKNRFIKETMNDFKNTKDKNSEKQLNQDELIIANNACVYAMYVSASIFIINSLLLIFFTAPRFSDEGVLYTGFSVISFLSCALLSSALWYKNSMTIVAVRCRRDGKPFDLQVYRDTFNENLKSLLFPKLIK